MQGDAIRMTLQVTDILEGMGITYAVGGSMSSSVHGIMRSTMDVDIIADIQLQHIPEFVAALSKEFYADEEMIRDAIKHHGSFNLIHLETAYKVDVFIPKQRVFDQLQLQRRIPSLIMANPDRSVYVTSPEDIILSKLEWYRMGGEVSDQQWRDILGVMKTRSGQLDLDYLRKLSRMLNVEDLFKRILRESR